MSRTRGWMAAAAGLALLAYAGQSAAQVADEDPGEKIFGMCMQCHAFKEGGPHGRVAPNLWGVFGRKAGTAPGYEYSLAIKESGIVWTETTVDKWLQGPRAMVPGAKMDFELGDESERELVLEFIRNSDIQGYLRAMQQLRDAR